jgi:hypothetical protein
VYRLAEPFSGVEVGDTGQAEVNERYDEDKIFQIDILHRQLLVF